MSNNSDYVNFYNKIFFTIVRANFPKVFAEIFNETITDETITDETITDETIMHQNFFNSIKNYPYVFDSTKRTIKHGILDIDRERQFSETGNINKVYSSLGPNLILKELLDYKNMKNITDQQLERFIDDLNMRIAMDVLPMKTAEELKADQEAEAAERALAAQEDAREAKEEELLNWENERERMQANPVISTNNNRFKTRLTTVKDKMEAARREAEDAEFAQISGDVIMRERAAMAERMRQRQRQTKSILTTDATRKARGGGLRRRRKTTRKLRKHYKSRKSSNKYIRRKK
jgi:hypothetical protein